MHLIKRPERLRIIEFDLEAVDVDEIRRERCIMERIEPVPRWTPAVVVEHHPAKPLDI